MNRPVEFRSDINALRGLSVILVGLFHLQWRGAGGGFIGVDVFFVISGYLMTQIIWREMEEGRFSLLGFVAARAARIWPALAVMLLLLFALGALWLPPFDLQILAEQAQSALLFGSNHFFHGRAGYNTQSADTSWLLHTWSLSVEWQFYLLYPLVLMAVAALRRRLAPGVSLRHALTATVVLLFLLSCAWHAWQTRTDPEGSFFLLPARTWELLAGALVCLLERDGIVSTRRHAVACHAGVLLIVGAALLIAVLRLRPVGLGVLLWVPVAGAALVLWARDAHNVLLRNAVLQRAGLWSYSIYLWHWPVMVALRMTDLPAEHPGWTAVIAILASAALGGLSYTVVERRLGARHARQAWRNALRPLAVMALAGVATVATAASNGLDFRARRDFYRGYRASVVPLYFPDRCGNFKTPPQRLTTCTVHEGAGRRVLVIGDSHADHLYAWFARHSAVPVDFLSAAECPPVPHFERLQAGYHCKDFAAIAWDKALSDRYDTVVVSARWATVGLAGAPYCHEAGGRCSLLLSVPRKQQLVRDELRAAVERTLRAGKTVVMVPSAPESHFRVPERLAREQFWFGQPRLTIDARTVHAQTDWLQPLLTALAPTPRFHVVSLRDRLCDATTCRVYDAALERPIYVDESHFDPVWMAQQTNLFEPFVQPSGARR